MTDHADKSHYRTDGKPRVRAAEYAKTFFAVAIIAGGLLAVQGWLAERDAKIEAIEAERAHQQALHRAYVGAGCTGRAHVMLVQEDDGTVRATCAQAARSWSGCRAWCREVR